MGRSDLGLAAADPEDWSSEAAAVSATGFRVERELEDERPQARGRRCFGPRWASQGPIWVLEGPRGWERLGRRGEATWQRGTGWRARGGDVEGGDWQDGGFR